MPIITTLCTRAPSLVAQPPGQHDQLLDDLAGREVAAEAHRAGRAERARERAARLRRQADGAAVAVPHRDGLDRVAVGGAQAQLDRAVGGDLLGLDRRARAAGPARRARARSARGSVETSSQLSAYSVERRRGAPAPRGTRARRARRAAAAAASMSTPEAYAHASSELPSTAGRRTDRPAATERAAARRSGSAGRRRSRQSPPARSEGPFAAATTVWGRGPYEVEMSNEASGTSATGCSRAGVTPPSGAELSSHALDVRVRRHGPLARPDGSRSAGGTRCPARRRSRRGSRSTSPACTCAPVLATGA